MCLSPLAALPVLVLTSGCVHAGCGKIPAPLLVPIVAVAAPIMLVRGDFSHGMDPTFEVTDLVGADLAATRTLAREVSTAIPSHAEVSAAGAGMIRASHGSASVRQEIEAELAKRRGRSTPISTAGSGRSIR